jgi:hypothetical protein
MSSLITTLLPQFASVSRLKPGGKYNTTCHSNISLRLSTHYTHVCTSYGTQKLKTAFISPYCISRLSLTCRRPLFSVRYELDFYTQIR